jgi:hypothetical protein
VGVCERGVARVSLLPAIKGNGTRISMPSTDMMPAIAEPFFEMGARVEMSPAMNFEELKKGLNAAIK